MGWDCVEKEGKEAAPKSEKMQVQKNFNPHVESSRNRTGRGLKTPAEAGTELWEEL